MATGIFADFTEAEVLAIRAQAKTLVTEGKTLMTWDSGNNHYGDCLLQAFVAMDASAFSRGAVIDYELKAA